MPGMAQIGSRSGGQPSSRDFIFRSKAWFCSRKRFIRKGSRKSRAASFLGRGAASIGAKPRGTQRLAKFAPLRRGVGKPCLRHDLRSGNSLGALLRELSSVARLRESPYHTSRSAGQPSSRDFILVHEFLLLRKTNSVRGGDG